MKDDEKVKIGRRATERMEGTGRRGSVSSGFSRAICSLPFTHGKTKRFPRHETENNGHIGKSILVPSVVYASCVMESRLGTTFPCL